MFRGLLIAGALVVSASCKKESSSSGLPPAKDWQSGGSAPQGSAPPASGMPSDGVHGGAGGGGMPNDDIHGGGQMPNDSNHAGLAGGGASGGGAMPAKTAPQSLEKLADGRVGLGPFSMAPPKDWTEKPSTSSMRAAQFTLAPDTELIIYYFGESGAGSVQDNLDRWLDQFQQPDGKASKDVAKVEKLKIANQDATAVSVAGRYVAMAMPGATQAVDKADAALLGAIVESPKGPYYFKVVGAKKTVDANAAKFRAMLTTLKLR